MPSARSPAPTSGSRPARPRAASARPSEEHGDAVVAVGHQPDCGRIAAELTGGPEPRFPTAGMVVIELADA